MGWRGKNPGQWARETQERIDAVFRASVQQLFILMSTTVNNGGLVPVKTGNLYRSLLLSSSGMPTQGASGDVFAGDDVGVKLLGIKAGGVVYLGYQANYAHRMNYGFVGEDSLGRTYNFSGFGFVEDAASQWPQIVEKAARLLKSGVRAA